MTTFSDDFNRSNEDVDADADWTTGSSGTTCVLVSNTVQGDTDATGHENHVSSWSGDTADYRSTADASLGSSYSEVSVWGRAAATAAGYALFWNTNSGGSYELYDINGDLELDSTTGVGTTGTRSLSIVCEGTTITGYVDDVEQVTATDSVTATGDPGIGNYYDGGTTATIDNFVATDVLGATELQATRWFDDDGSETTATALAAQDTAITGRAKETNTRLRTQIQTTGDVASGAYKLQYRKVGDADSEWEDIA